MKIKVKTIKNPRQFPYQNYTHKVGKHKFEANLWEGSYGELEGNYGIVEGKIGKEIIFSKGNGKLDQYIDEAQEMSEFYNNLVDFLMDVKYHQKNKKKQ